MAKKNAKAAPAAKKAPAKKAEKEAPKKVEALTANDMFTAISEKCGFTKADAKRFYDAWKDTVVDALKDGKKVAIAGLGTLTAVDVPERTYTSFGRETKVEAHKAIKFKMSSVIKNDLK